MKQPYEGIFIVFILPLIVYLNYLAVRRFYYYFKGYSKEISDFLKENGLTLIEVKKPKTEDWKISPFETKDSSIFEFALPFSMRTHYFFIVEDKKNMVQEYWIRNRTPLFGKRKTEFKIAKVKRPIAEYINHSNNDFIYSKTDSCPACSAKIGIEEKECPDCGLVIG
ncbi:hypothetical protein [Leeuwenhoekiella sp. W20_SRS_FM14]|uniref:hypothetical protein n=1 Tax=Leeuwenhoekiella sp. W20_SRS_FM14 TaxID=3240270 RepID=UPI003F9BCAAC